MKHKTIKGWYLKLRKDGIRKRFLIWAIPIMLPHHHLAKNGPGRRKTMKCLSIIAEEIEKKVKVANEL